MHEWGGWHMGGMWLWWALGLAAIAAVGWRLFKANDTQGPDTKETRTPEDE
jgi:hypothetical protein